MISLALPWSNALVPTSNTPGYSDTFEYFVDDWRAASTRDIVDVPDVCDPNSPCGTQVLRRQNISTFGWTVISPPGHDRRLGAQLQDCQRSAFATRTLRWRRENFFFVLIPFVLINPNHDTTTDSLLADVLLWLEWLSAPRPTRHAPLGEECPIAFAHVWHHSSLSHIDGPYCPTLVDVQVLYVVRLARSVHTVQTHTVGRVVLSGRGCAWIPSIRYWFVGLVLYVQSRAIVIYKEVLPPVGFGHTLLFIHSKSTTKK